MLRSSPENYEHLKLKQLSTLNSQLSTIHSAAQPPTAPPPRKDFASDPGEPFLQGITNRNTKTKPRRILTAKSKKSRKEKPFQSFSSYFFDFFDFAVCFSPDFLL
jgi:hypothetical protein